MRSVIKSLKIGSFTTVHVRLSVSLSDFYHICQASARVRANLFSHGSLYMDASKLTTIYLDNDVAAYIIVKFWLVEMAGGKVEQRKPRR